MPPHLQTSSSNNDERFLFRSFSSSDSSEEDSIKKKTAGGFIAHHCPSSSADNASADVLLLNTPPGGVQAGGGEGRTTSNRDNTNGGRITVYSSSAEASYARIEWSPLQGAGAGDDSTTASSTHIKNPFDQDDRVVGVTGSASQHPQSPREINQRLNLHLGLPLMAQQFERIRLLTRFMNTLLMSWWDGLILAVLYQLPDSVLRCVIFAAWNVYFPLHQRFLSRSTGLDPSVSLECHALSTVLYLVHFAVTRVSHIRYGLHILSAVRPAPPKAIVETIEETVQLRDNGQDHAVLGRFLHYRDSSTTMTEYTLVWIYGGAFLSGDAHGNVGTADVLGQSCCMDVWVPDYRKAPSHDMDDIMDDISSAYQWVREKRTKAGLDPSKIVLVGWSAGAALCTRLMQSLEREAMPQSAVLFSPFVQYERPAPESSMRHYSLHDWLVTRNIMDVTEQTLAVDTFWGNRNEQHSPLAHSMIGLPPLCVIVSEHEAVYDQTCVLMDHARRDGVPVTAGVWRYMAHGWYMLGGLLPEGERALHFASQFIQAQCDGEK
jgi:epsilon-lactone hydrolase